LRRIDQGDYFRAKRVDICNKTALATNLFNDNELKYETGTTTKAQTDSCAAVDSIIENAANAASQAGDEAQA
jgi:hypothetical protein